MLTNIGDLARPEIERLEDASLEDLYRTIGMRMADAQHATEETQLRELGSFDPTIHTDPATLAPSLDLADFGKRVARRVNKAAYDFFCREASEEERQDFFQKINLGSKDAIALLAGLLVSHLAVAPAVAGAVALVIYKLIVTPLIETSCETWGEVIEQQEEGEQGGGS